MSKLKCCFGIAIKVLQNRSKSTRRAHTSHTCPSHRRISKPTLEKTSMSRDRVQSIAFWEHTFDFRWGFAVVFESTTEPQRECQKDNFEHAILTASRRLQWFPKSAHKKALQNHRLLESRVPEGRSNRQNPRSGEHMCATPEGELDFEQNELQMRARWGDTH